MNLIIKMAQESYNNLKIGCTQRVSDGEMIEAIKNGTPIPDNATNGDVIKAMFGVEEVDMSNTYGVHFHGEEDYSHYFFKDWWNAPYQKGGKE